MNLYKTLSGFENFENFLPCNKADKLIPRSLNVAVKVLHLILLNDLCIILQKEWGFFYTPMIKLVNGSKICTRQQKLLKTILEKSGGPPLTESPKILWLP